MIDPVVDLEWARAQGDEILYADVRYYLDGRSGRDAYAGGHLPGAIFVDVEADLSAPAPDASRGRHPLPDPETFAARLGDLGVAEDKTVIAYDDAGGVMAARLVWMLRALGQQAALLDGGLTAYAEDLETTTVTRGPVRRTARPWPAELLAGMDDAAGPSAGTVVIDARQPERFRGETEPIDPRAGHIPGARNLPARDNVGLDARFRPVAELRERFAAVGIGPGTEVVAYCGSGVTACHDLLALEHAGLGRGRLYPGSWSEYAATDRPAATGD